MKKILIVTEVFYPENGLINDFATALVCRGFQVEVLTQHPSYPAGKIFDGYTNDDYRIDEWNGIKIHRFRVVEGYCESKVKKVLNYWAFVKRGGQIARRIGGDFDHILVYQTGPLTLALPAIAIKKKFGTPVTTWSFDIWPDAVYAYGFPRIFPLTAFLNRIIKRVYKNSDNILVSSQRFAETILAYAPEKSIGYAPNWLIDELQQQSSVKLDAQKFNFTFTGNISISQNLKNVVLGWQKAGLQSNATLNIVGDGSSLGALKELIEERKIEGIVFHGRHPSSQILDILHQSNVLVLPLVNDPGIMKTEPYKLQSYLKSDKPIYGIVDGAARELIEQHRLGVCAQPDSIDSISNGFVAAMQFEASIAAQSGALLKSRYNREQIIERVICCINK